MTSEACQAFVQSIEDRTCKVGIIGLGYVGLPLIDAFITAGFSCFGFDVDASKVDSLLAGKSYIKHIGNEKIQAWLSKEKFEASADMSRLSEPDVLLICVPTPLDSARDPDLSYVVGTCEAIAKALRPGQLVVLESTTYPTTTRDVMVPILEAGGLVAGKDFFVAYSPEREDPGNPDFSAAGIPKVVGAINEDSQACAAKLYGSAVAGVIPVGNCEIAEAAKVLENIYRAVNIALVNELKTLFDKMGIDVWDVINAAKTKPFGFQAFYPGPGLGGHCIPIDPFYLSWLARKQGSTARFIELAGEVNRAMPNYVVSRTAEFLNEARKPINGSKICLLGMAYKKDVDDPRESPSFELMELLLAQGADLTYSDPHVPKLPAMRHYDLPAMESQELTPEFLASCDAVLIATDHTAFDYDAIVKHCSLVVDTRNATQNVSEGREKIRKC
ncbi:nucleotide sugar dehydrogenase [Rhodopirellula sp. MGV]|uniref:nucleotide sugar dehydrogenase n=1 Tax=Rhodopirellula sp. MGV TaxID=2023130 RepID=UPI000B967BE0|nr:nucleotide sugar dehydrogenase [Rhodopirellula sp. MGV]OYP37759.1 UDP-N-acetyl-D-glucosamine dehydrogenase [Rhodopirellula sp. MGV]PNY37194.1 nucleotide sugar dehydrogenase [Rhodopirellula baltica]